MLSKKRALLAAATAAAAAVSSVPSTMAFVLAPSALRPPLASSPGTTTSALSAMNGFYNNDDIATSIVASQQTGGFSPLGVRAGSQRRGWFAPRVQSTVVPTLLVSSAVEPEPEPEPKSAKGGGTVASKAVRSAGVALALYCASSAAALAVTSVSGLSIEPRTARKVPIGPTLLLLYVLSNKRIKTRNRFDGVIPRDDESVKLLADDAYDLALSWGKPAGRIALLTVDLFFFLAIFRYSGYDFRKLLAGQGLAQLMSKRFWVPYGVLASLAGTGVSVAVRRFGQGYVRSTMATMLAPGIRAVVIKPAKAIASALGVCADWDLGLTPEQRKGRRSSRELRESLSTFNDVEFDKDEGDEGRGGGEVGESPQGPAGDQSDGDDGAPPDLKRTT